MMVKALREEAERRGSWRTAQRAKAELGIASKLKGKAGPEAGWVWSLPEDWGTATPVPRSAIGGHAGGLGLGR